MFKKTLILLLSSFFTIAGSPEFLIASEKKHPIYLIGGFGGAAKAIVDIREGNDVEHGSRDSGYRRLGGVSL